MLKFFTFIIIKFVYYNILGMRNLELKISIKIDFMTIIIC